MLSRRKEGLVYLANSPDDHHTSSHTVMYSFAGAWIGLSYSRPGGQDHPWANTRGILNSPS